MLMISMNRKYLAAFALLALPSAFAELSQSCLDDLSEMYDMSSLTYNTLYESQLVSSMISKLDIPFGAKFHVFNGNMIALDEFADKCTAAFTSSDATTGGRLTFLSSTKKCTQDYNIGIPACIPTSCGPDDALIAKYLTDNPTPLFDGADCSDIFWANEGIMEYEDLSAEISTQCISNVLTVSGSAMAGASNITAIGDKTVGGECTSYYDGKEYGTALIKGSYMEVNYEQVCDGEVSMTMEGLFCMPSICDSKRAVAAALNEITHAEESNPYFAYLLYTSNWRASCKWIYNVPPEETQIEVAKDSGAQSPGADNGLPGDDTNSSADGIGRFELMWVFASLILSTFTMVY